MKQIFRLGLVVAVLLTTISSYAINDSRENYILYIKTGNGKVLTFTLDTVKSNFTIYDENNNLLYTDASAVSELEISKTLSLEGYPSGTYYLEIQENNKTVIHKIIVSNKKSKTVKIDESVNQSPAFRR